uniref:Interleukin 18 receptor accessory protein n=1 Tax=Anolis carolinensis TaxID=28377 RepID=H9GCL5_ANOCA|nr:PREDICTED: interleukin-18 receptor accessory protein [Anolis carolinensis]|eukprot:XP_016851136.1 PREDICTED: interleukin-18 receptor accessory protein [Anolis carolinensis]
MLFYWIILLLMKSAESRDFNITGCLQKPSDLRYRAISDQKFVVSCDLLSEDPTVIFNSSHLDESQVQWFRQSSDGGVKMDFKNATSNPTLWGNALWFNPLKVQHSGTYVCINREKISPCINIFIVVETKNVADCSGDSENEKYLFISQGTSIACPGKDCYHHFQHSSVKWYKNGSKMKHHNIERPGLQFKGDKLVLRTVYDKDNGTYVCDYTLVDNSAQWQVRTVVEVIIIAKDTLNPPTVLYPSGETILEVELGQNIELECKAKFGFEMNASSSIQWYIETSENKELASKKRVHPKGLEGQIFNNVFTLMEIMEKDLRSHFICLAQNSIGNSTGMFRLKRKTEKGIYFLLALCCTITTLLGIILGSTLAYWRWIDLVLIYRYYLAKDETIGDCKEYDAFVSYAKPDPTVTDKALCNDEQFALEFLPQILENEYGYTLCLKERNILPGGAYTDDIVNALRRSRRAIMVLSPSYFKNTESLFELEAAVNTVLDDKTIKLILIQFEPFQEPQLLPQKVKKVLKILPRITWEISTSSTPNKLFSKKLWYCMPVKHTIRAKARKVMGQ